MTSAEFHLVEVPASSTLVHPLRLLRDGEPALLRAAAAIHRGALRAPVVLLDAALVLLAVVAVRGSLALAAFAPLVLLASGQAYRDRDRVVSRGVAWWPRPLALALALSALPTIVLAGADATRTCVAAAAAWVALLTVRSACWLAVQARRRAGHDLAPCLVVGDGDRAATLARTLERHLDFGLAVTSLLEQQVLRDPVLLARAVRAAGAQHVFLVADGVGSAAATPPLRRALGVRAHVSLVPFASDALLDARAGHRVGGVAVLPLGRPLRGPGRMLGKRPVETVVAALLLALSAPVLLLAAIAIKLDDRGPVLYRQRRTGRNGVPFDIVKLRTMREDAHAVQGALTVYNTSDGLLFKMAADPRVTRTGAFLRRSGMDELPQLLNVLRGQMSLVGPRPLPVEADAFSERDAERHLVRPGMTGLWQVSGGATLRYREMVDLDLAYVHGWTPALDLQVLLATVGVLGGAVLHRR